MLYLNGFELYSRWVPQIANNSKNTNWRVRKVPGLLKTCFSSILIDSSTTKPPFFSVEHVQTSVRAQNNGSQML